MLEFRFFLSPILGYSSSLLLRAGINKELQKYIAVYLNK